MEKKTEGVEKDFALFYGVPFSHGSIGVLVSAKLKIIPCKPFVKLTYVPCNSLEVGK